MYIKSIGNAGNIGVLFLMHRQRMGFIPVIISLIVLSKVLNDYVVNDQQSYCSILIIYMYTCIYVYIYIYLCIYKYIYTVVSCLNGHRRDHNICPFNGDVR